MPSDRSRAPDKTRYGYTGVVAQQGRVILDRDFNAQQSLTADRIAADALDFVGPCGTPDNGFAISLPGAPTSPPTTSPPTFWSPPVSVPTSPPETPGGAGDFLVAPGTMYLGGQRVFFPGQQGGAGVTYSYFDQPDWPAPPAPSSPPPGFELVYLSALEQEVSAVEDPDLFEVALAGPDTTQRLKLMRRIERSAVGSASCSAAWQTQTDRWAKEGWILDPATMQLKPTARLEVGFTNPGSDTDPCDPQASGGYLGADNQLIRVRIDRTAKDTGVLWGYDDASFIYRITQVTGGDTLTLAADPPDPNHFPTTGQYVEILATAAVLAEEPDESDPNNPGQILRLVAEADGVVRQLSQPYGPLPGSTSNVIVLADALPAQVAASPLPLFLRVWQARQSIDPGGGTVTLETTTTNSTTGKSTTISTGVTATISGAPLADGAYWEIAVRPSTPQGVYPEDLLVAPQAPVGPRRWACPLAVIDWGNQQVTDCRSQFQGLVALSKRKPGCCTVAITTSDVTATTSLQALIDNAATLANSVTVCLQPGTYQLPGTLYLDKRHAGLTLEGCGGGQVVLTYQQLDDFTPFLDGIIAVERAAGVTLQGLALRPPIVETSAAFFKSILERLNKQSAFSESGAILRRPYVSFGIRAFAARRLTIERCNILLSATEAVGGVSVGANNQVGLSNARGAALERLATLADFFGAAIFVQGRCDGLKVEDCVARSTLTPTYTSLAVNRTDAAPTNFKAYVELIDTHLAAPEVAQSGQADLAAASSPPPSGEKELAESQVSERLDRLFLANTPSTTAASPPPPPPPPPAAVEAEARLLNTDEQLVLKDNAANPAPPPPPPPPPPPAAPTPSEFQSVDQQVNASLELVASKRLAVGAAAPRFAIVTVGILAASSLDATTQLGEALVSDNAFDGFTFATWFSAYMEILRLEENTVSNGVAGLWLEAVGAGPVPGAQPATAYYQSTILFEEYQLLTALAPSFPAPASATDLRQLAEFQAGDENLAANQDIIILREPPPYSLVISGNQVDVRQQTADVGASSAMLLALYQREVRLQPLTSIIVQSNRLCGGSSSQATLDRQGAFSLDAPAALVTLQNGTSCAINGNIVINRGGVGADQGTTAPSLWVTVSESEKGVEQLAITGNVLKGQSDLARMHRLGISANWSVYNANPS